MPSELVDWWANCLTTPEPRTLHDKYLKEAGYYIMSPAETAKALTFKILELAEEKQKVAVKDVEIARLREVLLQARKWVDQSTANVLGLSPAAAKPGDQMLAEIDVVIGAARSALNNGGLS